MLKPSHGRNPLLLHSPLSSTAAAASSSALQPQTFSPLRQQTPNSKKNKKLTGYRPCRVEFSNDDAEGGSAMDSTDARFAVMGVISFIPYFNWLSWIFAWLDTGKRRYAVYALVYLVPYLRTNLSLSPEENWLPIASIVFCIIMSRYKFVSE
nr:uncharacterized protein LOC103404914 [Malus domestica]